ncbi:MAG: hypothetical protein HOE75_06945 [Chloroflexi bacterium]|nr:hypothetical protein [Chloroflexota bacterium]
MRTENLLRARTAVVALGALSVVAFAACGSDGEPAAIAVPPTQVPATAVPTTPPTTSFDVTIENVGTVFDFTGTGVGGDAPAGPGDSFTFEFDAAPGSALSFATMFVPSNDFFFAPGEDGIALFDSEGSPISGDVTSAVSLWDAGTEADQEPGAGSEQPLMNGGNADDTADTNTSVREAADTFGNLPAVGDVVKVSLDHLSGSRFMATIENVSTPDTISTADGANSAVPLTPPVWVVHSAPAPLFSIGEADRGEGLETLAETGSPATLSASLTTRTGLTSPLAPGAFAVHTSDDPIFTDGAPDRGEGLEALAEDGSPDALSTALAGVSGVISAGAFAVPSGSSDPGPLFPGSSYSFTFTAEPGDNLSFATMLVQTNDLFYGPNGKGIALFDGSGNPVSGDITSQLLLWDAGTETNQSPGTGSDQAPRQAGANTGDAESGNVQIVQDEFSYPGVSDIVRVTITPGN